MNINKYIEQAYAFFTALAKEVVKELRPDNKDVTTGLVEAKKAIAEAGREVANEVVGVNDQLLNVIKAIEDKPVVEAVEISNLTELSDGISMVIDTLKKELGKLDKEIVVKNDLSQLTALFKSGDDKKDLLKALKSIENKIKQPEIADYTLILDELVTLVENIKPEIDLSGVLELLGQIAVGCNRETPDHLAKYAKYDRLKVELSDAQIKKMAANVTVAQGGTNGETLLRKLSDGTQIAQMYGKTGDTTFQVPRIDPSTHSLQTVDYAHHEIHSGSSFTVCHTADVPNAGNLDVLITTPNTAKWAHMTYEMEAELEVDINIYEAPTTTGGTVLDIYNRNRNSAITATATAAHTPSVSGLGTKIRCWHMGSARAFGGGDRGTHEIILKQNTKYLFRMTNATANNNFMAIKIDWYEHSDKSA